MVTMMGLAVCSLDVAVFSPDKGVSCLPTGGIIPQQAGRSSGGCKNRDRTGSLPDRLPRTLCHFLMSLV